MKKHVFLLLLVFSVTRYVYAGGETFFPDHWANKVINTIISAGYLKSLQSMPRPLERQDVAQALFSFDKSNLSDPVILSLISKLETELNTELKELLNSFHPIAKMHIKVEVMGVLESRQTPPATETLIPESRLYNEVANIPVGVRSKNRVSLGFAFQKEFGIYASATLRQQGVYDESYSPPYSVFQLEKGYMAYSGSVFRAKLGRDYIDWGYGTSDLGMSHFGLSYYLRPLNHLMLQFNSEPVKFTYLLAYVLEPNTGAMSGILSAGRFDFSAQFENFGVLLGVWQTAFQNTNTSSIDWSFIVPLNVYAAQVPNSSQLINTNTGFDVLFSYSGVRVYGSLVWNIMGQNVSAVEQSLMWMAGFKMSNLFQFASVYGTELLTEIVLAMIFGMNSCISLSFPSDKPFTEQADFCFFLYNSGDFYNAERYFEKIVPFSRGTSIEDKVHFYAGMSNFINADYTRAIELFRGVLQASTFSLYKRTAFFMIGLSFYKLSPIYSRDQQSSVLAIQQLQAFIDAFPPSDSEALQENLTEIRELMAQKDIDSLRIMKFKEAEQDLIKKMNHIDTIKWAETLIHELRNKLAQKAFDAAVLYQKINNFIASEIYYNDIEFKYADSDFYEKSLLGRIHCLIQLKKWRDCLLTIEKYEKWVGDNQEKISLIADYKIQADYGFVHEQEQIKAELERKKELADPFLISIH
ncbi:hypothetical protein CHS0354_024186 [Potamilus streckersoni]|uniref:Outer membrane lipoprotein BamD-like domain-containing protein n=1 Tax=Potamilus streckersoni TaxID=2493646 RepID=A0AAE0VMU0_9BIVA|nr:hypothetical protein CHS0354_024186 [Potamilus streckersoni]